MNKNKTAQTRLFELDWLRVILVFMVFLHHVCMPFNGDKFHIMNAESSKLLDDIMVYFEQWRLPLLLLISGAGTVMAFSRRTAWQFVKERGLRLLIPLIFGVMFVVPPQTFFEYRSEFTSYMDLYPRVLINGEKNHLWFIEFLFMFSIICLPLILFLRSNTSAGLRNRIEIIFSRWYGLLLWVLPLLLLRLITNILIDFDGGSISKTAKFLYYLYFFVAGIVLISCKNLWATMQHYRFVYFRAALISLLLFYGYYYLPQTLLPEIISREIRWAVWWIVSAVVGWTTMLSVIGFAAVYLNRPNPLLAKLNEAVYPFYILHQTVIVVMAYYIIQWDIQLLFKLLLLAAASFSGIILLYGFVYRFNALRLLFGMKPLK